MFAVGACQTDEADRRMAAPVGIYISVPFCRAKCSFCNFASDAFAPERMQGYVDRLCVEMGEARADARQRNASLPVQADTVYFGGGTPSLLAAGQFRQIFERLGGEFDLSASYTFEHLPTSPQITLDATNLTDEPLRSTFQYSNAAYSIYNPGRTITLGVRGTF